MEALSFLTLVWCLQRFFQEMFWTYNLVVDHLPSIHKDWIWSLVPQKKKKKKVFSHMACGKILTLLFSKASNCFHIIHQNLSFPSEIFINTVAFLFHWLSHAIDLYTDIYNSYPVYMNAVLYFDTLSFKFAHSSCQYSYLFSFAQISRLTLAHLYQVKKKIHSYMIMIALVINCDYDCIKLIN
jgi:hypothetical protein